MSDFRVREGGEFDAIMKSTVPGYGEKLAEKTETLPNTTMKKMGDEASKIMRSGIEKASHAGSVIKQAFEAGILGFCSAIVGRFK